MAARLTGASRLLKGVTRLSHTDYRNVLEDVGREDIIYMDPPYQGVSEGRDHRYVRPLRYEDFAEALADLNARSLSYIVSYDGRSGEKRFGKILPDSLGLTRIHIDAGRSSQATLLGRDVKTVESLYLSPILVSRITEVPAGIVTEPIRQLALFG